MRRPKVIPPAFLEPLTNLKKEVDEFAELLLPDYLCATPILHDDLKFRVVNLDETGGGFTGEDISLRIKGDDHTFTIWARQQLLSHLGTREKWFERVTLEDQARELHRRIHVLDEHVIRRMKTYENINYVRAMVSKSYTDIPDAEIMEALCAVLPDGDSLKTYSGKTHRGLYAYCITRGTELGISRDITGHPGAIVINSEVGATSLWVVPFFLWVNANGFVAPVALRKQPLLRKVHRGKYNLLKPALTQALDDLKDVWGPLRKRFDALLARTYPDEKAALEKLEKALTTAGKTKRFIGAVSTTYSAANNSAHNGFTILEAVLKTCATTNLDLRYDDAEVAGYLLLHLL